MEQNEQQDTRRHYVVPMEVTVKVENAEQAAAFGAQIAELLTGIRGVSVHYAPKVTGVPQAVDYAKPLNGDEAKAFGDLVAGMDDDDGDDDDAIVID